MLAELRIYIIVVSDIRQCSIMHTFTAHNSRIRSITIDPTNGTLVTGSIDGELKVTLRKIKMKNKGRMAY